MCMGVCIFSKKEKEILYKNNYFQENFINCESREKIINLAKKVSFVLENYNKNRELDLQQLLNYLEESNKNSKISQILATIKTEKKENITIKIGYNSIYWNDTDCNLLIFENIDKTKELIQLKEESKYKDTVLSNVSHEFRTPLNCIIFMLESIKEQIGEIKSDLIDDFVEPALGSAKLLLFQVNDLLDNAQIINGKLKVFLVENNLIELGKEIVKMFKFLAKTKKLEILFEYNLDLPKTIQTDAMRFKQIINNLIGNSLKFTKNGSITLKFEKENNEKIKISVKDTGIGISSENQQKLFNAFSKISNNESSKMNPHGIGLGLNISNKLVKALNSNENEKIYVKSKENEGSTFYFFHKINKNFEQKKSCEIEIKEVYTINSNRKQKKYDYLNFSKLKKNLLLESLESVDFEEKNINRKPIMKEFIKIGESNKLFSSCDELSEKKINLLAVDDSGMNLLVLKQMCKKLKINITTASDGQEAVNIISKNPKFFHIVFMDCEMPVMDGFQAARIIREKINNKEINKVCIVGCTGYSEEKEKKKCIESGMVEVLVKPFDINEFKMAVLKYCN